MKYYSSKYLLLILLLIGVISCSKKAPPPLPTLSNLPQKEISVKQINFVGQWMGEGNREVLIRNFVREYEFLNQEIDVNLQFPEEIGFNRYNISETREFVANICKQPVPEWDIFIINGDVDGIGNYMGDKDWAKKNLVDFSQFPELSQNTIPEIELEKIKKRWGGIIPGPFLEGQYWALWTNKNVVQKLGIEVKQYGMTFDDFLSYVKAVDNYNKNNSDYIKPFQEAGDWSTIFTIGVSLYISEFSSAEELMEAGLTEQKLQIWHKTLKTFEQVAAYNFINDDWKGLAWNDIKHGLLNEECLFFSNGSWMYNIWLASDPSKVMNCVPNEFPTFKPTILYPSVYPIMWGVHKNAPNKKEAIDFLLDMSKPAMAESWVRNTKCPTGIKGNVVNTDFSSDQYENFATHIQKTYGTNTYKMSENSSLIFGSKYANETSYFVEVVSGELTADQAMVLIRERFKDDLMSINN